MSVCKQEEDGDTVHATSVPVNSECSDGNGEVDFCMVVKPEDAMAPITCGVPPVHFKSEVESGGGSFDGMTGVKIESGEQNETTASEEYFPISAISENHTPAHTDHVEMLPLFHQAAPGHPFTPIFSVECKVEPPGDRNVLTTLMCNTYHEDSDAEEKQTFTEKTFSPRRSRESPEEDVERKGEKEEEIKEEEEEEAYVNCGGEASEAQFSQISKAAFSCVNCSATCKTRRCLLVHMRVKCKMCRICYKVCSDSYHLNAHMYNSHGEIKPNTCTECYQMFSCASKLKVHIRAKHAERPFSCKDCDKSFLYSRMLIAHMRTHSDEKPYTCKVCDKSFVASNNLKCHMFSHTAAEKQYSCKECNKGFTQMWGLKQHMFLHTGERPYTCKECGEGFTMSSTLKRHIVTHNRKIYTCGECNITFRDKRNFKQHMAIHARTCRVCNRRFKDNGNFKQHIKIYHGL